METLVSPSLLSADFLHLYKDIEMINNSEADYIHMDIMDGVFVPRNVPSLTQNYTANKANWNESRCSY